MLLYFCIILTAHQIIDVAAGTGAINTVNGSGAIHTFGGSIGNVQTKQSKPTRVALPRHSNQGKSKSMRLHASQRSDHVEPAYSKKIDEDFANLENLKKPLDSTIAYRSKEMPKQLNSVISKSLRLHASQSFDHSEYSGKIDEGFANFEYLGKPLDNTIAFRSKENMDNRVVAREALKKFINLVNLRLSLAKYVVKYKVQNGLDINDQKRENMLMDSLRKEAEDLGVSEAFIDVFFTDQMEANKYIQYEMKEQRDELNEMEEVTKEQFEGSMVRDRITQINTEMLELIAEHGQVRKHPECLKMVFEAIQTHFYEQADIAGNEGFGSRVPLAYLHAVLRAFSHFCENSNAEERCVDGLCFLDYEN